jgi:hypothetical protein
MQEATEWQSALVQARGRYVFSELHRLHPKSDLRNYFETIYSRSDAPANCSATVASL